MFELKVTTRVVHEVAPLWVVQPSRRKDRITLPWSSRPCACAVWSGVRIPFISLHCTSTSRDNFVGFATVVYHSVYFTHISNPGTPLSLS